MKEIFAGVYALGPKEFGTLNLAPGRQVYGEELLSQGGREYRVWNPSRSKLGAAVAKGVRQMPVRPGATVLYLGAATGTTASHVSDVVGPNGVVICIEFAPRSMRDLVKVCESRPNMLPILADARMPDAYASTVLELCGGKVDVVFEDVSDAEQVRIMVENCRALLKDTGTAMLAVKARSISGTGDPRQVFAQVEKELESTGLKIVEKLDLEPFEIDHEMLVLKKK